MKTLNWDTYLENAQKWVASLGLNPSRIVQENGPLRISVDLDGTGYYYYQKFEEYDNGTISFAPLGGPVVRKDYRRLTVREVEAARLLGL